MDAEARNDTSDATHQQPLASPSTFRVVRVLVALVLVVLLSGLLAARIHSANQAVASHSNLSAIGVRSGQLAPDFTFTPVNGASARPIQLSGLRGRVVVVNFWSPSCAPCQDEAPILAQMAKDYSAHGVTFLGVAFDSSRADILDFLRNHGIAYASGLGDMNTVAVAYGLVAIPVTVVVDRTGKVVRTIQGAVSSASLGQALYAALSVSG